MNTSISLSHRNKEPESGVLYIVGTPIGNLDDISKRSSNILKEVSLIACEDTRTTGKLLNYLKISNKLISYHKYSSQERISYLISRLDKGDSIALVSEAGMPLISDPGDILVRTVKDNNFDVICIPGPCAAITGLVSSGISSSPFTFYGFIPRTKKNRDIVLKSIVENQFTSIIYESPKRVIKLLTELCDKCDEEREFAVLKELTKKHEKHYGFDIKNIIKELESIELKGEFIIIVSGNKKLKNKNFYSEKVLKHDLNSLIEAGLSHSAASNYLAKKTGVSKNIIYKLILNNHLE